MIGSSAFAILAIVHLNPPFVWLIAALILAVAFSRMTLGVHYITDILTGFALTFTALLFCDHFIMARASVESDQAEK